jgi:hypothetical protein
MKVIDIARMYLGEFEKPGNSGFLNAKLQTKLEQDGWKIGEPWCCYFQEMIFEDAYPEHEKMLDRLFSANCVQTLSNFKLAGFEVSTIPAEGALMIMQNYKDNRALTSGHAGIVSKVLSNSEWKSIEGNTNAAGSREGTSVQEKTRSLKHHPTGLRVAGFVLVDKKLAEIAAQDRETGKTLSKQL